jgi:glutamate-1-semialdehyde 2,1-aminomutase
MPDHAVACESLADLARRVLPGGGFGNMPPGLIVREGRAGHVWDSEGREFVDFLIGSGPMFVGHAHPEVVAAVQAQIPLGATFFADNEAGIRLAAAIVDAVACADQVRFVSSGTEADAYAMRLARAFRGRDKILKFEGGYHGMSDYGLMSLAPRRPGNFPQAVPDSPGIPRAVQADMLVAPFNDAEMAASLIRQHRDELAGVIVEPLQRLIPPRPGFLETLRAVTAECDIPLIFDEVVTGFRLAYGGAQEAFGVTPDICTLGKIIGGGFPLAAVAGRADIMAQFDRASVGDDRFMTQIGTLSGNPVAAVAGLATLEILRLRAGGSHRAAADGGHRRDAGRGRAARTNGGCAGDVRRGVRHRRGGGLSRDAARGRRDAAAVQHAAARGWGAERRGQILCVPCAYRGGCGPHTGGVWAGCCGGSWVEKV